MISWVGLAVSADCFGCISVGSCWRRTMATAFRYPRVWFCVLLRCVSHDHLVHNYQNAWQQWRGFRLASLWWGRFRSGESSYSMTRVVKFLSCPVLFAALIKYLEFKDWLILYAVGHRLVRALFDANVSPPSSFWAVVGLLPAIFII